MENLKNEENLLNEFLKRFPKENIENMDLETYTNPDNKEETFTYWVEFKLNALGGIRGGSAYKYGIYKYNLNPSKRNGINKQDPNQSERNGYKFDDKYSWAEKYSEETAEEAWTNVRNEILEIIKHVSNKEYEKIEKVNLGDAYKWKIAFLYSKGKLVPVYKHETLLRSANRLGIDTKNCHTISYLQKELMTRFENREKDENLKDINDIYEFGGYIWKIGTHELEQSNQIIKYGAPGTGKTYTAKKEAEEFFDIWKLETGNQNLEFSNHTEFVQFHPTYTYEDFIEGIKPVMDVNGKPELKLKNGVFKTFCKEAAKYEIWLLKHFGNFEKKKLDEITVGDVIEKIENGEDCPFNNINDKDQKDLISKYIPPYFFIIDEINRADLSRVFGELMYCLEYRGYEGRIKTQYSEIQNDETVFYDKSFFIPNNLYIIGTMNNIDRSVESFDFALRRRFLWQRVDPDKKVLEKYFNEKEQFDFIEIINNWGKLNENIEKHSLLGKDYQIGHSYLMKLDKYPNCTKTQYKDIIWNKHIKPILEEYFRGTGEEAQIEKDLKEIWLGNEKKISKIDNRKNI